MIREVGPDDVEAIADLAEADRLLHAAREPRVWSPASSARQLHPLLLRRLLDSGGGLGLLDERGDELVGVAIAAPFPRGRGWTVEELTVRRPRDWPTVGRSLLVALAARLGGAGSGLVVPCGAVEAAKADLVAAAGLRRSAWLRHTSVTATRTQAPEGVRALVDADLDGRLHWRGEYRTPLALVPLPGGRSGLVLERDGVRSAVSIAGSMPPPAGHDADGPALVIGPFAASSATIEPEDVVALASAARWLAGSRGDAHLLVVCGPHDADIDAALAAAGYDEPLAWWALGA